MWTCVTIVYLVAGTLVSARLLTSFGDRPDRRARAAIARSAMRTGPVS
jgi:hypothetical protein